MLNHQHLHTSCQLEHIICTHWLHGSNFSASRGTQTLPFAFPFIAFLAADTAFHCGAACHNMACHNMACHNMACHNMACHNMAFTAFLAADTACHNTAAYYNMAHFGGAGRCDSRMAD